MRPLPRPAAGPDRDDSIELALLAPVTSPSKTDTQQKKVISAQNGTHTEPAQCRHLHGKK